MSITSTMTALANAVRSKTGATGPLTVAQMTTAINGITPDDGQLAGLISGSATSITIPSGVTHIKYYAFYACRDLTSVVIPSSVKSIAYYAFAECSSLESVTIPSGVESIAFSVFRLCIKLQSVTIPASVTEIGHGAFSDCISLTDIYCGFAEGAVSGAPWGATHATIHYNSQGPA